MGTINQKDSVSAADIAIPFADAPVEDSDITALQSAIVAALPPSLGQALEAASLSVVLASDQSPIDVTLDEPIDVTISEPLTVTPDGGSFSVSPSGGSMAVTLDEPIDINDVNGGYSIYRNLDLNVTGSSIKGSAGVLYGYYIYNKSGSTKYIKIYNKATAPVVGTDVPVMTIPLPGDAAANIEFRGGISFSLGIGIGATTGVADADVGAPSTNDIISNILYK